MTLFSMRLMLGLVVINLVVTPSVALSAIVPALDVSRLVQDADVIVVGVVTSLLNAGRSVPTAGDSVSGELISAELTIAQLLKGRTDLGTIYFTFVVPDENMGYGAVPMSTYRIFFLKKKGEYQLELVSPYHPSVVGVPVARESPDVPLNTVVRAVGLVLDSKGSSHAMKREAIHVLGHVKDPLSTEILAKRLKDNDDVIRLSSTATLLTMGDDRALAVAEAALMERPEQLSAEMLQSLRIGLSIGVFAERALPSVVRLLSADEAATRRAGVSALRNSKSRSAIPALLKALDDSDFEVRLESVRGLARITGQLDRNPSSDAFRADEQRYLTYWKEWAQRQR